MISDKNTVIRKMVKTAQKLHQKDQDFLREHRESILRMARKNNDPVAIGMSGKYAKHQYQNFHFEKLSTQKIMNPSRKKFRIFSLCFIPTFLIGCLLLGPQTQIFRSFTDYLIVKGQEIYLDENLATLVIYYSAFSLILSVALGNYQGVFLFSEENDFHKPKEILFLSCVGNITALLSLWIMYHLLHLLLKNL